MSVTVATELKKLRPDLSGGLFTYPGTNVFVNYLFKFKEHGWFSPEQSIECTDEEAKQHNEVLDDMLALGCANNCEIGQWGTFYYDRPTQDHGHRVRTWLGKTISDRVTVNGRSITFKMGEKVFRGRLPKDADVFNFKRIK